MRSQQLRNLSLSSEYILAALGLERRRTLADYLAPAVGVFGAGLIVGTSLALLFAPKPGTALRSDLGRSAGQVARRVRGRRSNGHGDVTQLSQDELLTRGAARDVNGNLGI